VHNAQWHVYACPNRFGVAKRAQHEKPNLRVIFVAVHQVDDDSEAALVTQRSMKRLSFVFASSPILAALPRLLRSLTFATTSGSSGSRSDVKGALLAARLAGPLSARIACCSLADTSELQFQTLRAYVHPLYGMRYITTYRRIIPEGQTARC
jgi:hypothetical protein